MFRVLLVVSMLLLAACASAPTQEMSDARQAVRAARDAGAEQHAPVTLQDAESKLDNAGTALHSHDYRQARKNALAAKVSAINAQDMAYAIGSATAAVNKARRHGVLSKEAEQLLDKAHRVASEGDVHMAVRLANEAKSLAEQDLRLD